MSFKKIYSLFATFTIYLFSNYNVNNEQLKTIYIYNFLKHIEWRDDKTFSVYSILIITDNINLKTAFNTLAYKKQVHKKPIIVDYITSINDEVDLKKYQLIMIDEKFKNLNNQLLTKNGNKNTLVVTFNSEEKNLLMLNFYYSVDNRLLFELNRANLLNNGLVASDEIILLGGREIDVAEIYKDLKNSLANLEKSANYMKLAIQAQQMEMDKQQLEVTKKLQEINKLNINLAKSKEESIKQQQAIIDSKNTLSKLKEDFIKQQTIQQKELEKQRNILQAQLQTKIDEIKLKESILNKTIQENENELEKSKIILEEYKLEVEKTKTEVRNILNSKEEYLKEINKIEQTLKDKEVSLVVANSTNAKLSGSLIISVLFIIVAILFVIKITRSRKIIEKQTEELRNKKNELEFQKTELEIKTTYLNQSIEYASYIQQSIMPDISILSLFFNESFVIWEPKDQVGGDIFFFEQISHNEVLVMIADCTSHGVPGAFITILVKALEKQLVNEIKYGRIKASSPADMLGYFNRELKHILKQFDGSSKSNVGFDGGILYFNSEFKVMTYSGAQTPLYYLNADEIKITKYDRQSVGYSTSNHSFKFTDHTFSAEFTTRVYLTTDGYYDQVGSHEKMMYGKKRLGRTLQKIQDIQFQEQKYFLKEHLKDYQGHESRRDDVTLIGLKV